ncbi:hypothetical protein K4749_39560 [Streptomyces sp. TRM72054]|uniref:hypothetical protein n=1 Tax=Streptomyces sp. TRM72054 TaxID=2870562 RepID=UPI001C8C83D4|nr:hypothetical protein [Streptomyces sp. TRM72054]MBX9399473.1 hypothetical protein [Streptomyces sp. TRM72054]
MTPLEVQRLAYIRFLFEEGIDYSRRPAPLSATAVLVLHDAVELFLGLAADHHATDPDPKIQFMAYWAELKKSEAAIHLPGQGSMRTLNDVRVAMKHHGTLPAEQTIERSAADVLRFFTTATPVVFGVDFDRIDMADLVTQKAVAQLLRDAQPWADRGDHTHAMAGLSLAMDALLDYYARPDAPFGWRETPFSFGPAVTWRHVAHTDSRTIEGQVSMLSAIAKESRTALQIICLGIDFPSFARFQTLVPRVHGYYDHSYRYSYLPSDPATPQQYSWARHFVIESALRASRADEALDFMQGQAAHTQRMQSKSEERAWTGPPTD